MEGYETSAVVGSGWVILGGGRFWSSVATVPEYAEKGEKNNSACANSDASDCTSTKP